MIILPDYTSFTKAFDENLVLPEEQVENADLYKLVLYKIMITRELIHKVQFLS